jgi:hypothetical protein
VATSAHFRPSATGSPAYIQTASGNGFRGLAAHESCRACSEALAWHSHLQVSWSSSSEQLLPHCPSLRSHQPQARQALAITDEASPLALRSTCNRPRTALHRGARCLWLGSGTMAPVSMPWTAVQALARDLPETTLRVASRRPTTQPSAAPHTCAVVWVHEVPQGVVNHPSINGMQGVRGSNPLSSASSAQPLWKAGPEVSPETPAQSSGSGGRPRAASSYLFRFASPSRLAAPCSAARSPTASPSAWC